MTLPDAAVRKADRRNRKNLTITRAGLAAVAILACFGPPGAFAADEFSARVQSLLAQMTLDEKVLRAAGAYDPAYGGGAGYIEGIPRLGIPPLRLADGPGGVYVRYDTTALPNPIALASTFSSDLARAYGEVLGRESRATRTDVLLGPMINVMRVPNWGRNATSFGEDPYVIAALGSRVIEGIQSTGTMSVAKHFIANNQSTHQGGGIFGRDGKSFDVDERTLHEIYLPGFEAAADAGVAGMMAAYNKINGHWNAENAPTLTGVLRDELDWNGFVVSDWHANRSLPSISAGLDLEMPAFGPIRKLGVEGPKWGEPLKAAVESGAVPAADLDRAVGRLLQQMENFGFLDHSRPPAPDSIDVPAHAIVARQIAAEGAVLLKNDGVLPLDTSDLSNLLLVGTTAAQLAVGSGISGFADRFVSPMDALATAGGRNARIRHVTGAPVTGVAIPARYLAAEHASTRGMSRYPDTGSAPVVDPTVEFIGDDALPVGRGYVWKGTLTAPETGDYDLQVQTWGGRGILKIAGQARAYSAYVRFGHGVPRNRSSVVPTPEGMDNAQATVRLQAGETIALELDAQAEPDAGLQVRLAWVTPRMRDERIAEAVTAARRADTVIVFAWARSGEFDDPDAALLLPSRQDELIDAVASANENTIVVLNSASPHSLPWRDKVRGIVYLWFPGQEGGQATADVLLGRVNPSGKLVMTFPRDPLQVPAYDPEHPERYQGTDTSVIYSEGIFNGYRHYDEHDIEPLYPFGYGLSYTTFAYSNLRIEPAGDGFDVSFRVRNTGDVAGTEIAQVYLGRPTDAPVPMAPKALVGFDRVRLAPGRSADVTVHIGRRQLSYWSASNHDWRVATGVRPVLVATSSADTRLTENVEVE